MITRWSIGKGERENEMDQEHVNMQDEGMQHVRRHKIL